MVEDLIGLNGVVQVLCARKEWGLEQRKDAMAGL